MTNHYLLHLVKGERKICRKGCLLNYEFHRGYKGLKANRLPLRRTGKFLRYESIHSSEDQTPMNKSVRLNICLLSDKIKLQNQSKATEGATELKKEEKECKN